MLHLQPWQWIVVAIAAAGIGLSKTGVPGLGIVAVALFAVVLPSRESVGIVLPILLCGDVVAVSAYRRHAVWSHLWLLFPWAALGVIMGYLAMGHINEKQMSHLIGGILILLVALQLWRRKAAARVDEPGKESADGNPSDSEAAEIAGSRTLAPTSLPLAITLGVLAGFTTMVANAAGPIMILYLLAMRLPKMEFIGTAAWYFLVLNLFKVPFSYHLGLINSSSLPVDFVLGPFAILGALFGRALLPRINQSLFENLALILTVAAALKLLY